ncbi:type II toxin-antitoxin system PrlF family antitoxin [Synechococcus sp. J7-Johnson]|uniref:type II toxin-antitoxin system PrlF family antitoxin n=1 Tax=Synechococcus sp. J7-Johnson TaxID=2823737 RepID=UPI0020CCD514|nr:type II toxin-antitoxin system PrlF family antitoxin [Synechococcus sp. J7-Johnson]MCP9841510.1 type II toxin-antitoxin system PrlF family antitoxin [Synechococcus sp. J7-Johnson]
MATVLPSGSGSARAIESTLTDRYQTTIPQEVRRALGLQKRDRISYSIGRSGEVVLERHVPVSSSDDPALAPFLALLAGDIAAHPERLRPVNADLAARLNDLVGSIEVDLDAPLDEEEDGDEPSA